MKQFNNLTIFNKKNFLLALILLLGITLRFYKISSIPNGFNWDEAAVSYNAWSIAETAHDEHGVFLPLAFQSFNDYKAPGLIYLLAGLIKIFGPQVFIIRYTIAAIGILTILVTYFLVKNLAPRTSNLALLASFLLAISPWHLLFSRPGFEASLGLLLNLLGILFLLKFLRLKKSLPLLLSFTSFILSAYSYHSPKIFLLFFIPAVILVFFRQFQQIKLTKIILVSICCLLIAIPLILSTLSQGGDRFRGTSIFGATLEQNTIRPLNAIRLVTHSLIQHLSPEFWLIGPALNWRIGFQDWGLVLLPVFVFAIIGLINARQYLRPSILKLLFIWFLAALIPPSIGIETPHALRAILVLPLPAIFAAVGIIKLSRIKLGIVLFIIIFFSAFLHYYFLITPKISSHDWLYGHQEMINFVKEHQDDFQTIKITDYYQQAYIFYLWFAQVPPYQYQAQGLPKINFDLITPQDLETSRSLIVAAPHEVSPSQPGIIETISNPLGKPVFYLINR
jgi:4-amino-4-deoxy-L-arabinose transferase-like glycosyltransferase